MKMKQLLRKMYLPPDHEQIFIDNIWNAIKGISPLLNMWMNFIGLVLIEFGRNSVAKGISIPQWS